MWLRRREPLGLVLLALGPTLFVGLVYLARTGWDSTTVFIVLAVLGLVSVLLVRMRRVTGIVMLLSVVLYLFLMASTNVFWAGSHESELTVQVRDADTGQGIVGATVSVYGSEGFEVKTDPAGVARIRWQFFAFGERFLIHQTGFIEIHEELTVDVAGYESARERLRKRLGPS